MKLESEQIITTRIAGTKHYDFNFPDKGDRVILVHNPYNKYDKHAIMVVNQNLQLIGHLTKTAGFNQKVGALIEWKPFIATVNTVYPQLNEIFIDIDTSLFKLDKQIIDHIFRRIILN